MYWYGNHVCPKWSPSNPINLFHCHLCLDFHRFTPIHSKYLIRMRYRQCDLNHSVFVSWDPTLGSCRSNHLGYINGLAQERRITSAHTMVLRLSCTNLWIFYNREQCKRINAASCKLHTIYGTIWTSIYNTKMDKNLVERGLSWNKQGQIEEWPHHSESLSLRNSHSFNYSEWITRFFFECQKGALPPSTATNQGHS